MPSQSDLDEFPDHPADRRRAIVAAIPGALDRLNWHAKFHAWAAQKLSDKERLPAREARDQFDSTEDMYLA